MQKKTIRETTVKCKSIYYNLKSEEVYIITRYTRARELSTECFVDRTATVRLITIS